MKIKIILLIVGVVMCFLSISAQRTDVQNVLVATLEKDVYKLFDRMLDSARMSNNCLYPCHFSYMDDDVFGFSHCWDFEEFKEFKDNDTIMILSMKGYKELKGTDTIIIFEQNCRRDLDKYICKNFYWVYLSVDMQMDFYERLLDYFAKIVDVKENYCMRNQFVGEYSVLRCMLIKRYESEKLLNKRDSLNFLKLIERTILDGITKGHLYSALLETDDKYITNKIRNALINILNNPFYPTEYYEIFMSHQDTSFADTTNIPDTTKTKYYKKRNLHPSHEESVYYSQLSKFSWYEKIGKKQGLSPGQAYLKKISECCIEKGYVHIDIIEEYAYKKQDELLIKHLKEFKKKHPDYPLKYF
jgi:hypothetical protein